MTIRRAIRTGELRALRLGSHGDLRIPVDELERVAATRTTQGHAREHRRAPRPGRRCTPEPRPAPKPDDTNGSPSRTAAGWPELPRRHLSFERFGIVVDERNGDVYRINRGEVDVHSSNIAAFFFTENGDPVFLEGGDPMTHKAVIRIAQVATPDLYLSDTIRAGRELWHTHALQLAPNPVVLVNHIPDQVIGRVIELDEWDDTTGRWVVARCELDDPPGWLRGGSYNGTAASMWWIDLGTARPCPEDGDASTAAWSPR